MVMEVNISVALCGAGIFARDAYVPLLKKLEARMCVNAVWSRSEAAAATLAAEVATFNPGVRTLHGDSGLDDIMLDPNIQAVLIVLPVQVQLPIAERALRAGKHVLQEKPFAPTVAEAKAALESYFSMRKPPLWALAENYRNEIVFREAAAVVPSLGPIIKMDLIADMPMTAANKYFNSAWRRDSGHCPGGFLMESSVHFIGALRMLARAAGFGEVVKATSVTNSTSQELPAPDSLTGVLLFENGRSSSVSITFASGSMRFSLSVVGSLGSLEVQRGGWGSGRGEYTLSYQNPADGALLAVKHGFTGIEEELDAFISVAQSWGNGEADSEASYRISAVEGAKDLAVMEALLQSGATGSVLLPVQTFADIPGCYLGL